MKNRLISIVLLIAMLSSFSLFAFAETVMLDRSLPSFDEETAYKNDDYFGTSGVRGTSIQGNGALSLYDDNGNKMIKMAIKDSVSSGYNYAMMTMFVNRNLSEYYKKGLVISYDLIAPENGKIVFHTYGTNYPSRRLYSVDNLTLIPASAANTDVTDITKQATLEKGKLHNIKLILDTSSRSYTIFLDGIKVGDTYTFQDNYFASTNYWDKTTGEMKEVPPMYLSLRTNDDTTSYPLEAFVDNLKITSYNEEAIEVSSSFDILNNTKYEGEFSPLETSQETSLDIFNNIGEDKEVAAISLKYKTNINGYKLLEGYSLKKLNLTKGYNRETIANMLIPDNDSTSSAQFLLLDSLYEPAMSTSSYTLINNGTNVTVTNNAIPALPEDTIKGTLEVTNLDNEVTVSGIVIDEEGEPLLNVPVGLTILNKDVTKDAFITEYNALNAETSSMQSLIYTDLSATDIEGKYSFKIEMPDSAEMGDYLLIANVGGKEVSTTLRYLTTVQKQSSIIKINDALSKTSTDFLNTIGDSDTAFSLSLFLDYTSDESMYNSVKDKPTFFELVKSYGEYSEELSETGNSVNQFNINLDNAILLSNLESIDELAGLKLYAESIAEETGLLIDGISAVNSDYVYTALKDFSDFSSLDKINKCIAEAIVLYNIPNAENWGAVKTAIESYSTLLGLDLSDSTVDYDEVYHEMYEQKGSYTDIQKIISSFNALKLTCPIVINPPPIIKPSVSVGGGGGGGVAARPQVDEEVIDEEVKDEESKEESKDDILKPEPPVKAMNFTDVSEDFWGYDYIKEAYEKGLVNGISENEFNPDGLITREEFVALLVRCAGLSNKDSVTNFSDIKESDWYFDTVKTAYAYGIIKGRENGAFGAGESITRQDIAVMIKNMADNGLIPELKGEISEFADADEISDYALSSVNAVSAQGIFSGYEDLTIRPKNNATRAEATAIILRIFNMAK